MNAKRRTDYENNTKLLDFVITETTKIIKKYQNDEQYKMTNYELSLRNLLFALNEMDEVLDNIYDYRYYFGSFPYARNGISKYRYLRKTIVDYNNMIYMFIKRLQTVLKKIGRSIKKYNKSDGDLLIKIQERVISLLSGFETRRGSYVHKYLPDSKSLNLIGSTEILSKSNHPDSNSELYERITDNNYKSYRSEYKGTAIKEHESLNNLVEQIHDYLYRVLIEEKNIDCFNQYPLENIVER